MSSALYLAIDQGGHGSRACVFDERGELRAAAERPCAVRHPRPHYVEHDPEELLDSVHTALAEVWGALGPRRVAVAAAGLATQRSSVLCWDRQDGRALSPVLSWQDTRAHQWIAGFGDCEAEIHERTGLRLSAHYGVGKLRWCLDHLDAVRTARVSGRLACGPLASFLLFRLLGERPLLVDPANASRTLLWSLHSRDWDPRLLDLFGVPRAPLPNCVPSVHSFGTLRLEGRALPLRVVSGDQSAALYAGGEPAPDTAFINIGTGAFLQRIQPHVPARAWPLLASVVLQDDAHLRFALEGTVNGAGSALQWLERGHGLTQPQAQLEPWLAQVLAPPLFLNGISGLGSPYWVADFHSRFIGTGGLPERAVAVVESIVFLLLDNLERMDALAGPARRICASGGLARSDGLCQRLADASGLPVQRLGQCEASARGLAYVLAGAPKNWPDPAGGHRFEPTANAALRNRYRRWRAAMQAAVPR